jgi:hypothetical protein
MSSRRARGQANLAALGVALLVLTTVAGLGLGLADGALAGADRTPLQRHAADGAADRLVAADSPTTLRANVLNASTMADLSPADLDAMAPAVTDYDVRVTLDDRTVIERGDPAGGVTVRRTVLVAEGGTDTRTLPLDSTRSATLPRRTDTLTITVRPGPNTTVTTVRVDGRVVLHDPQGLAGRATVDVSRYDTLSLTVETAGAATGDLVVGSRPTQTTKRALGVTVGV